MNNKEFSTQSEARTLKFAIAVLKLSSTLPSNPEPKTVKFQISKSATSVGLIIVKLIGQGVEQILETKLAYVKVRQGETLYWLEIMDSLKWVESDKMEIIMKESKELLAIFTSIGSKLNKQ